MSFFQFISLPNKIKSFRLSEIEGREEEFGLAYETYKHINNFLSTRNIALSKEIDIVLSGNTQKETFNECFKNPFIYGFYVVMPWVYDVEKTEICSKGLEEDVERAEIEKIWDKERSLNNQILYHFLYKNLYVGNFVEIYVSWQDNENCVFETPTMEYSMDLKDLLRGSRPDDGKLEVEERKKLTIYRNT